MQTLSVELGERRYPIFIGANIRGSRACFLPFIRSQQVLIVSNDRIAPLYLDSLAQLLREADKQVDSCILPDGEAHKNLTTLNQIFDVLLQSSHNRHTTVIALGGGVVGDMAGFAAACYQRGVNFVQVPTTLLAQVDSSVGGKTGVNHALGKNMIGAFYQPQAVVIDTTCLQTLPDRELIAGIAEVIKYGLIADAEFFAWLEARIDDLLNRDSEALAYAIRRSCELKAKVVAEDEREGGVRAILNLGHTFGHAIEAAQGYGNWLHGEAVGAGMVMALRLSAELGWISEAVRTRGVELIRRAGLPVAPPADMSSESFLRYMAVDKKVLDRKLRLVLLRDLGEACVTDDFDHEALHRILPK